MSRPAPPKPWELRKSSSSTSSNAPLPVSASVAHAVNTVTPTTSSGVPERPGTTGNPHIGKTSPSVPPRPTTSSSLSSYSPYSSPYSSYSSYSSPYSSYSSYRPYSSYGSYGGYGGYGSYGLSRYGSGYYGSNYGSSYGGYGSYGNYGSYGRPYGNSPNGVIEKGYQSMDNFRAMLDGFSVFTRLLDANFDAVHGSFASVLRLFDVFGEFFYVVRTFTIFRLLYGGTTKLWRLFLWAIGMRKQKLTSGSSTKSIELGDYQKFQSSQQKKKAMPFLFVILGITCVSAPMLLTKLWRAFKEASRALDEEIEMAWDNQAQTGVALYDFRGETEMDLSFKQGDVIKITNRPFPEWWEGELNGRRGLFPVNFVSINEPKRVEPVMEEPLEEQQQN